MQQHQEHYGKQFYLDKSSGYWISLSCPKIRAHVWVWECHHGKSKPGFHVHHLDGDKSNNKIENLQLLSVKDHVAVHYCKKRAEASRKRLDIIRPMTKEWHASPEGLKWHSEHAFKTFKRSNSIQSKCICCESIYVTDEMDKKRSKFCSNNCKSKHRRDSGIDNVEYTCELCKLKFYRNKYYDKARFCSRECSNRGFGSKNKIDK